jgi:YegS/Rv2252/BmrU family lipid kinase
VCVIFTGQREHRTVLPTYSPVKALLIINPNAGRRKNSPLPDIKDVFESQPFFELEIHETTGPGDATCAAKQAALDGYDLVIAAGGDGSIFEVANGLVGSQTSLGVIPIGTENVLAREMGVPLVPREACHHILQKEPRAIDTGKLGDQHFVCFAGIGFDAHVAHNLPSERKRRFGAMAYFLTSAQRIGAYRKAPHRAKITVDGETHEMEFLILVVSNIRKYGGGLIPAPHAKVDDGLLDVCIFPKANYLNIMKQMAATTKGKHLDLPGIRHFQGRDIVIETESDEQIQLDGDAWPGSSPFCISVVPKSLRVRF